ncbi:hypothetical protein DICSQDRAFT_57049 [Dichomitus squalens LYAD-421 SS1]|uniref:uncharacterized protein n=1 Tax=Dichomitus squalens (strain LYAD-421) TaxID=732165 RepID=UPI0004410E3C|nr:uncharacterized protein DICSQDRAFT_57049 [Dichomitus squalens LYAD-421 SS1]EJF62870.1 hypothetical protein DICSQDRAFT_57049 [Dichomitus squalens LYAD-421 SS1]
MPHRRKSRAHSRYLTAYDEFHGVAPRLNRLPQRLDYTLIPAPLDLSKPLVDEKSELPAIIVTPSSPVFESKFFIAFIAPPPSPTFSQRLSSLVPSFRSGRIRTIILLFLLLFIMASHVVIHRIATNHPHLQFGIIPDNDIDVSSLSHTGNMDVFGVGGRADAQDTTEEPSTAGFWNLRALWAPTGATSSRSFIVVEELAPKEGNDNDTPKEEVRPEVAA